MAASVLKFCSSAGEHRCLSSGWRLRAPNNTPANGVVDDLKAEQGHSSVVQSYLGGFSLELTMRVMSLYKKRMMEELRSAEEGEEPDLRSLASIVRGHQDPEEERVEISSDESDEDAPISMYEDLLIEAAAHDDAEGNVGVDDD